MKMPRKKTQKLVHLDIDELARKDEIRKENDSSLGGILKAKISTKNSVTMPKTITIKAIITIFKISLVLSDTIISPP